MRPVARSDRDALVVLLELTEQLTNGRRLEDSLQTVTDAALRLLPGDHASIRLLDASHHELLVGARSGEGRQQKPMTFRRGEGLIGWVVEHAEGIIVDDVHEDPRFLPDRTPNRQQGFHIRSLLAEPLWSAGSVIGVLSVSSPEAGRFTLDHQLLARLLANCSTPPIERARLGRLAMTDDLTLAYNQRYLAPRLHEEMERSRRTGGPLSMLLMDLDHFKRVNDHFGHATGDAVLRIFADRVRSVVRRIDVFIRRGGEEFTLIMPSTTRANAQATAERIRINLSEQPVDISHDDVLTQTVSIGVATWDGEETLQSFQQRADMAMYRAKELGRNQSVVA
ncbi:sensor domain-containing diguanylate cyclase [Pendulispora brunnea]|uniref:diguanylate cyclase n=1 Tax=Pendulispora brunnea TaxID=2905690 RepID=A0ABZ2KFE9_9BACT